MNPKHTTRFSLLAVVLFALLLASCNSNRHRRPFTPVSQPAASTQPQQADAPSPGRGLNRNPVRMHYTRHVRCRMGCRHIDETEIIQILKNGTINYRKSELDGEPCRHKYAVEGYTSDNQRLRVIFAPCGDEMTVVTCIDLEREWPCDCPGDHH